MTGLSLQTRAYELQSPDNYNEMISQLQKATMSGATALPSRDIPINISNTNNDPQIKPNFIPETNNTNYISNYENQNDLILQNNIKQTIFTDFQRIK